MTDNNHNAQAQIYGNGTVWITSVSGWSGKDRLTAKDLGKDPEDILDIIELGRKKIVPEEIRLKLLRPAAQITSLMSSLGKRFFIRGAWWIPNNHFLLAKEGIDKIQDNQDAIVDDLIDNLPSIQEEMIQKYPLLADAEWPSTDKIRSRFSVKYHVCEIHGAEVSEADPEELVRAKREFQERLKESYEEYKDGILLEAKVAMIDAVNEIADKVKAGDKITAASLGRPKRIVDDYLNIADIFDLDDVRAEVLRVRAELESTDAADIRTNWDFAQDFADTMKDMAASIGNLSGLSSDGTTKRVVRKAA